MAFTDFPFVSEAMNLAAEAQGTFHSSGSNSTLSSGGKQQAQELAPCSSVDQRRFCSHTEVLRYLAAFASFYQLHQHIQLGTQVTSVELIPDTANHSPAGAQCNGTAPQQVETNGGERNSDGTTQQRRRRPRFRVHTAPAALEPQQQLQRGQVQPQQQQASHWLQPSEVHEVDAVVVANGHYSEPSLPRLPGLQASQEAGVLHLHAHNYRHPGQFGPNLAQQTVLIVGASNSGGSLSQGCGVVKGSPVNKYL
jgi:cation diffusion facilitator CzcD-associated flavoprotein CzcO